MMQIGRKRAQEPEKPSAMVYDGTNDQEILDWSRDGDTSARFQPARSLDGGPLQAARLRLAREDGRGDEWVVVPEGATIHQDPKDGELSLELPADEETQTP
jgi:hypothetical protein